VSARASWIVFSGVEGLLIDPSAATCTPAATLVRLLQRSNVPLVLCSGRTRAELEHVRQALGIVDPFICEHGAAAFVPPGYFGADELQAGRLVAGYRALEFGRPYREIVEVLHRVADRVRVAIVSFSEMSVNEVAVDGGLPLLQAQLAKVRDYEEPFRLVFDSVAARARLRRALLSANLGCVSDGRYEYAGAPVDMGVGAQWLTTLYRRAFGGVLTIGIGDKLHHLPLLRRVDVPVVVARDESLTHRLLAAVPRASLLNRDEPAALAEFVDNVLHQPSALDAVG
jgi:mannosyl-3-phosphoglycerate phosphatase family protein